MNELNLRTLRGFYALESEAASCYDELIRGGRSLPEISEIRRFRKNHLKATDRIWKLLRKLGETQRPSRESSATSEKGKSLKGIFRVEKDLRTHYESALELDSDEISDLVKRTLLPGVMCHLDWFRKWQRQREGETLPIAVVSPKKISVNGSLATIAAILTTTFVVAVLYLGRELLVPLALAALLTFLLAPLVSRLERWLGKIGAVISVVGVIFASTLMLGWVLTQQAVDLIDRIPDYKENIQTKIKTVQGSTLSLSKRVTRTVEVLQSDLPEPEMEEADAKEQPKPMPVEVVAGSGEKLKLAQTVLGYLLSPLGTTALVFLLLIFMLLERHDLRTRMIRLVGEGYSKATRIALEDAGARISRYLLMQLIVNVSYGIPLTIGLYFIGVPNALLWGSLAIVLRFLPYVGPWIAASFPIMMALAVSPGWAVPLMTILLFVVLELISNNVMEPWLYGSSTGVTPFSLIVAALMWTLVWGPVGLLLATPLTVCLVVMGRHIPRMAILGILLSDEDPPTAAEECYRHLLRAEGHDEIEMVNTFLEHGTLAGLFDELLVPVLEAAGNDFKDHRLERDQLEWVEEGVEEALNGLAGRLEPLEIDDEAEVLCVPVRNRRDALAARMLTELLRESGQSVATMDADWEQVEAYLDGGTVRTLVLSVVSPTSPLHARSRCKAIRSAFPKMKIMVGMWGTMLEPETLHLLQDAGAELVVTSMVDALKCV